MLAVPRSFRNYVFKLTHDSIRTSFQPQKNARVFSQLYLPGSFSDICVYCNSCNICQRISAKSKTKLVPLPKHAVILESFSKVSMDIVGLLIYLQVKVIDIYVVNLVSNFLTPFFKKNEFFFCCRSFNFNILQGQIFKSTF